MVFGMFVMMLYRIDEAFQSRFSCLLRELPRLDERQAAVAFSPHEREGVNLGRMVQSSKLLIRSDLEEDNGKGSTRKHTMAEQARH